MARKTYSEEFRRQAVELYESTPGATYRGIAADLGVTRNTLKDWVAALGRAQGRAQGRASTTGTDDTSTAGTNASRAATTGPARPGSPQAELAALRARVAELESQNTLLATERDILRQAAKYFAGETRW